MSVVSLSLTRGCSLLCVLFFFFFPYHFLLAFGPETRYYTTSCINCVCVYWVCVCVASELVNLVGTCLADLVIVLSPEFTRYCVC